MSTVLVAIDQSELADRIASALESPTVRVTVTASIHSPKLQRCYDRADLLITDSSPLVLRHLSLNGQPLLPGPLPVLLLASPGHRQAFAQMVPDGAGAVLAWDGSDDCLERLVELVQAMIRRPPGRRLQEGRPGTRVDAPASTRSLPAHHLRKALRRRAQLISGIVHDLRTPLTAVSEFADLLGQQTDGALTIQQQHYVQVIRRRCHDAARMLDDLIDAVRIQSGRLRPHRQPVQLAPVLEDAADSFEAAFQHQQVRLELSVPGDFPPVFADRDMLGRIVSNLVSNALKFSPPGRKVTVRSQRASAVMARISVQDQGCGIAPAEVRRIFRSFVQGSNRAQQGSGLGLAIVRQLVRLHGGRVAVESAPGRGSTFHFTLPFFVPSAIVRRYLKSVSGSHRVSFWGLMLQNPDRYQAVHRLVSSSVSAHDLVIPDDGGRHLLLVSRSQRPELLVQRLRRLITSCGVSAPAARPLSRRELQRWLAGKPEAAAGSDSQPTEPAAGRRPALAG